jgi:alginate O-acetyltransferase complex protein AlgI
LLKPNSAFAKAMGLLEANHLREGRNGRRCSRFVRARWDRAVIFSSTLFIFYFLPIFLLIYYGFRASNLWIVIGSSLFYVFGEGAYILLLASLVAGNFVIGRLIDKAAAPLRRVLLVGGISANLAVLAFFKYANFLLDTVHNLTRIAVPTLGIHLPLGISFFTFQFISYLIDIGRRQIAPDRSITRFATYIMMFPHLIAGPIVRYADIDSELFKRQLSLEKIALGVQYFIVGLCQKVLIANIVAVAADKAFGLPASELSTLVAWLGVTAFTLQIYFDFCGYSNMAIGLAFLMGFRFPRNFNYPYISRSITEFWRRWHISLSFWFRDYVYISLGGNRKGTLSTLRNLLIVFFLTGLWHGAAWTFVLWGLFHGLFLMCERAFLSKALVRLPAAFAWAYTMLVVMLGWVLFKARDLPHAASIVSAMFGIGRPHGLEPLRAWLTPEIILAMGAGIVFAFPTLPYTLEALRRPTVLGPVIPGTAHASVISVQLIPILLLILGFCLSSMLLVTGSLNPFLYFRF